jgi:hypothetical protein
MTDDKKKQNFLWPDVSTLEAARSAAMGGAAVAGIIATITTAVAVYASFKGPVMLGSAWSFVDAALFAIIAVGIWRSVSRVAAVSGLLLYLAEQAYQWSTIGPKSPVLAVFLVLFLIHGVRGAFRYHQLKKVANDPAGA